MRVRKGWLGPWICLLLLASPALAEVVADAGDDVTAECASPEGAEVTLDGSGSTPGAALLWEAWGISFDDPTSISPTATFPLGTTVVTLTATEGGEPNTDTVLVTVEDETPPVAHARAMPSVLWPPNHELVEVQVRLRTSDACTAQPTVKLVSVESSEADNGTGDGNTTGDIQGADLGTDDRTLWLRAERSGNGPGRVYTLSYRVTDGQGNHTWVSTEVEVPHDQSMHPGDADRCDLRGICPLPSQAASEWGEVLPDPAGFENENTCNDACRKWDSGCTRMIAAAKSCAVTEARARESLGRAVCAGLADPAEQQSCEQDLRQQRSDFEQMLASDRETAEATCDSGADECYQGCDLEFP
jgi:hypothetical protein